MLKGSLKKAGAMVVLLILLAGDQAFAQDLRRFLLVVGANDGGGDRTRLRYAVSDAREIAAIWKKLGGVDGGDVRFLSQPGKGRLARELAQLGERVRSANPAHRRTEIIFYYSGHSDESGLLLAGERFPYTELRDAIKAIPADVRIAILDSCASGMLTRLKGGTMRPPFLVDASMKAQGSAFLTSSSHDESSQESDAIRGSFFTHFLLSGLRGAADSNLDGRVTLNEVYQFAFHQTLARTEQTVGGPQHPGFAIQMAGSGDVVLTDIRQSAARLTLHRDLAGRVAIRNASGAFVAELSKTRGVPVFFGLEAGRYRITLEQMPALYQSSVVLVDGGEHQLGWDGFVGVGRSAARGKGEEAPDSPAVRRTFPVACSLVPGIGFGDGADVHNVFHLSLGYGQSGALTGFGVAGGLLGVSAELEGLGIAGGAVLVGGRTAGAVMAGGFCQGTELAGIQMAGGFNHLSASGAGMQAAVGFNLVAGGFSGVQMAGGFNLATGDCYGAQLAGGYNRAGALHGTQIGVINVAGAVKGTQIGVMNGADSVEGVQIGVVNRAKDTATVQIGLVNFCGDATIPIGLVNVIKNGYQRIGIWFDELSFLNLGFRFGGRLFFSQFGIGWESSADRGTLHFGLGARLPLGRHALVLDYLSQAFFRTGADGGFVKYEGTLEYLQRLRLAFELEVASWLRLTAGLSYNLLFPTDGGTAPGGSLVQASGNVRLWPGYYIGVELF